MRGRARDWLKLIAATGAAQLTVQAIGFISGILVIRMLPVHEYALYTLANTMLGTMTILADSGVATGVMSQGRNVWQDKQKIGAVLVTGMALRRKFAIFSLLIALPVLIYLLRKHEASWLMSILIGLSLIPAFFSALSGKLLEIPLKLHQDIKPMQRYQVEANVGRLALLGLTMFAFPLAAVAILCAGVSQMWNNWRIRKASDRYADRQEPFNEQARSDIMVMVRKLLPTSIYYCISSQVSIWIISAFGSSIALAQVGALSRFAAVLSVVQSIATILLVPRFIRAKAPLRSMLRTFLKVEAGLLLLGAAIVGLSATRPDLPLKLLGDDYLGLTTGLVLAVASGCAQFISHTTYLMLVGRGIVAPAMVMIPFSIAAQCLLIYLLRPTTVNSTLLLSLLSTLAIYLARLAFLATHVKKNGSF